MSGVHAPDREQRGTVQKPRHGELHREAARPRASSTVPPRYRHAAATVARRDVAWHFNVAPR
jgi:hypothetical protein